MLLKWISYPLMFLKARVVLKKFHDYGKSKKGEILVIEGGLEPEEEAELIETTMREIDVESFVELIFTLRKR